MPSSPEKLKEFRQRAFANNKCTRCLVATPEDGKKTCKSCRDEVSNRKKQYSESGKCKCGREIRPTKSGDVLASCYKCRRHNIKNKTKTRRKMIAAGICVECNKRPAFKPHQRCKICLRWQREDVKLTRKIQRLINQSNREPGNQDKCAESSRTCSSSRPNSTGQTSESAHSERSE